MPNAPLLLYTRPETGELMRRRWQVIVVDGDDRGASAELEETPALIGAAPASTLVLTDDTVSRYHAEVDVFAEGIRVRDLDSTNGTYLEGEARVREGFVENGGTFRVGRTTIRTIAIDESAASEIPTDPNLKAPGGVLEIGGAILASDPMFNLIDNLRRVATSTSAVLFRGERGSGKATMARILHSFSSRARAPFVAVTAADLHGEDHRIFLRAHRGSLFIEDIERLDPRVQAELRSVADRGEVRPVGDDKVLRVDVRLFSATTVDPKSDARLDPVLLRRLSVVELIVPPLRDRPEDALAIARHRLRALDLLVGSKVEAAIRTNAWPGNVDGLLAALAHPLAGGPLTGPLLDDALAARAGDVSALAEALEISTRGLFGWLAAYDVDLETCMPHGGPSTDR